jgi:hypothetical protein
MNRPRPDQTVSRKVTPVMAFAVAISFLHFCCKTSVDACACYQIGPAQAETTTTNPANADDRHPDDSANVMGKETIEIRVYSEILTSVKSGTDSDELRKLHAKLIEAGSPMLFTIGGGGFDSLMVEEESWPTARRVALTLGVGVTPPESAFGMGYPLPDSVREEFLRGDWDAVLQLALETVIREPQDFDYDDFVERLKFDRSPFESKDAHSDKLSFPTKPEWIRVMKRSKPSILRGECLRAAAESHRRIQKNTAGINLPTTDHWHSFQMAKPRIEQIQYLAERIHLATGILNKSDIVVPRSIQNIASSYRFGREVTVAETAPLASIDPFAELWRIRLQKEELPILIPAFQYDWVLRPEADEDVSSIRMYPATRYCLCVILNDVFKKDGWIREYQLTDAEWGDSAKIEYLIENRKQRDWLVPEDLAPKAE